MFPPPPHLIHLQINYPLVATPSSVFDSCIIQHGNMTPYQEVALLEEQLLKCGPKYSTLSIIPTIPLKKKKTKQVYFYVYFIQKKLSNMLQRNTLFDPK